MKIDPYEELANAVILQAAKEYKHFLKILKNHPQNATALYHTKEIEEFFLSDYFRDITDADGEFIITELKEQYL